MNEIMQESNFVDVETTRGRHIRVLTREHPRARRLSLSVGSTGPRVSSPRGTSHAQVKAFLRENVDWLEKKLRDMERQGVRLAPPIVGVPDTCTWRGRLYLVRWENSVFPHVRVEGNHLVVGLELAHEDAETIAQRAVRNFVASQMKQEVARIVKQYTPRVGKSVCATRLLSLKSLWGSLSVHGRMTLDLSLMLAPVEILEYVIVHEMCHLWVRNHGPRFWGRVAHVYPQFDQARQWMSQHGHGVKVELARWTGNNLTKHK